jgi:hypothetical protein
MIAFELAWRGKNEPSGPPDIDLLNPIKQTLEKRIELVREIIPNFARHIILHI